MLFLTEPNQQKNQGQGKQRSPIRFSSAGSRGRLGSRTEDLGRRIFTRNQNARYQQLRAQDNLAGIYWLEEVYIGRDRSERQQVLIESR